MCIRDSLASERVIRVRRLVAGGPEDGDARPDEVERPEAGDEVAERAENQPELPATGVRPFEEYAVGPVLGRADAGGVHPSGYRQQPVTPSLPCWTPAAALSSWLPGDSRLSGRLELVSRVPRGHGVGLGHEPARDES